MKGLLLSGGLDSTAIAHIFKPEIAFNIDYGQRPALAERRAALHVCDELDIELVCIDIDCSSIGSGDLSSNASLTISSASDWWPYRNQLLITFAATKAITMNCNELMIGTIADDSYHADGSIEFIRQISNLVASQEGGLRVTAPAITMNGLQLLKKAGLTHEQLAIAHSCHKANIPCGNCRGCNKYQSTMESMGYYTFD
jgi:7-cyano-7-deazaguanine synthase